MASGAERIVSRCDADAGGTMEPSMRLQHAAATFPPGADDLVRAFYAGALGLVEQPVPDAVADTGWIWFATDDAGVELHFIPDDLPPDPTRRHHFCLQVDDLERAEARLRAAGSETAAPSREIPGRRRLFVRDPVGNLVELVQIDAA
jgi:catechol 2,3-dioxygenase-like lactoylglutathione lyase family enzyme